MKRKIKFIRCQECGWILRPHGAEFRFEGDRLVCAECSNKKILTEPTANTSQSMICKQ